ncbi:MAG: sigma-70 family RNA polymerase sigma factor [Planctomycetales bacterium]|nr:sigma-70 family RNA polymerase sigma factor [Planctomycetales bacterium]
MSPSAAPDRTADLALAERAAHGDRTAQRELFLAHRRAVHHVLFRLLGSNHEIEDVVQDAFVQAYVKLDTFQQNSKFFTWIYRIAFNAALSRRRRRRVTVSVEQSREDTGNEPESDDDAPDDRMMREERVGEVQRALLELTEDHRAILILREMQEMAYEDIADVLNISIGTVRSRLSRARNALRDQLLKMQAEP